VSGPLISSATHDATEDTRLILTAVGKEKEESEKERKKN
jgi:hypothetical protein